MWWLWFIGPIGVVVLYVLTGFANDDREQRERAASSWRKGPGGGAKIVRRLPPELAIALDDAGGGRAFTNYELFPKIAYLALMGSDAVAASDHQTIVGSLDGDPPSFVVRPLPILDGKRVANSGVQFPKDEDFMAEFLVEGEDATRIEKWLSRPLRTALLDVPTAWLRVRGKTMALTVYGFADEEQIDELVLTADTIFAEHGAQGGPSLLGVDEGEEQEVAPEKASAPAKKAEPAKKAAPAKIAASPASKKGSAPKAKTTAAK